MRKRFLKISLFIIILLIFTVNIFASTARVRYSMGRVKCKIRGIGSWKYIRPGMRLPEGTVIRTSTTGVVSLTLDNGSRIKISPNTTFKIRSLKKNYSFYNQRGKVWTKVTKLKIKTYRIITPTAIAGVRGTEFIVEVDENASYLYVIKGIVAFGKDEASMNTNIVKAGFKATIKNDLKKIKVEKISKKDKLTLFAGIPIELKPEIKKNDEFAVNKDELKREILLEKEKFETNKELSEDIRLNDITTGRTLLDSQKNLVRVDQLFKKIDNKTIQLINITQKQNLFNKFSLTITFNETIPEGITGLFSLNTGSNQDVLKIYKINQIKNDKIDKLYHKITKDPNQIDAEGKFLIKWGEDDTYFMINDVKRYGSLENLVNEGFQGIGATPHIREYCQLYTDASRTQAAEKLVFRIYVINNQGEVLPTEMLTEDAGSSASSLLGGLGQSATDIFITVEGTPASGTPVTLNSSSLDMTVLPDIFVIIVKEMSK